MTSSVISTAIEQALRAQLGWTDQPRVALAAIGMQLFAALDSITPPQNPGCAHGMNIVRREFRDALEKLWLEYGEDGALPPSHLWSAQDELRAP